MVFIVVGIELFTPFMGVVVGFMGVEVGIGFSSPFIVVGIGLSSTFIVVGIGLSTVFIVIEIELLNNLCLLL